MKNLILIIAIVLGSSNYSISATTLDSPISNYVEVGILKIFKKKGKGFNYKKHRRKMNRKTGKRRKNCKPSSQH